MNKITVTFNCHCLYFVQYPPLIIDFMLSQTYKTACSTQFIFYIKYQWTYHHQQGIFNRSLTYTHLYLHSSVDLCIKINCGSFCMNCMTFCDPWLGGVLVKTCIIVDLLFLKKKKSTTFCIRSLSYIIIE